MKRKPFGLLLWTIPFVFIIGVTLIKKWQAPFIGKPYLRKVPEEQQTSVPIYDLIFEMRNYTSVDFQVRRFIVSGASELVGWNSNKKNPALKDGADIGVCSATKGEMECEVDTIKAIRTKPIVLRLEWKHGAKTGTQTYIITPQMKP